MSHRLRQTGGYAIAECSRASLAGNGRNNRWRTCLHRKGEHRQTEERSVTLDVVLAMFVQSVSDTALHRVSSPAISTPERRVHPFSGQSGRNFELPRPAVPTASSTAETEAAQRSLNPRTDPSSGSCRPAPGSSTTASLGRRSVPRYDARISPPVPATLPTSARRTSTASSPRTFPRSA